MRPTRSSLFSLILCLSLPLSAATKPRAVNPSFGAITIGALFSLTGDGSSLGIASSAALDLAARDINQEFTDLHLPYHVVTIVADTKLTPSIAATAMNDLANRNAQFVIGPQSSAEAAAVVGTANSKGIIVISQGSTASSLALPNDNLFRLAPNDKLEGAAIAALIRDDGFDTLLPMWRADAGNTGLHDSTKASFQSAGGTVLGGVPYEPITTDFSGSVATLGNALRAAKSASPNAKIAVYLASFEEAASIFDLARLDADISAVRWYGGDGVVQSQALLAKASVAAFGVTTQFTAPNVGLDDSSSDLWKPVSDQIAAIVGFTPDAYALSVYDAAWVAALSAVEAQLHGEVLRESFVRNVQRYYGLTGRTALDANGDRRFASFDFWTIRSVNGAPQWVKTGQYSGGHVSR